jgi:galactose mutarotase-like enzyme
MSAQTRLANETTSAIINHRGAEPVSWSVNGRDLLWRADPTIWARTSPILFPIVGRARNNSIRVNGRTYPIGIHGFAACSEFDVVERTAASVTLAACECAASLQRFPFRFRLQVSYALTARALRADFQVTNPGDTPLPYALGFHPGFRWPFAAGNRDGYDIEFEHEEEATVPVITADGLFSPTIRTVPLCGRRLALSDALLERDALCFLNARSNSVRFTAPRGAAITLTECGFAHFAIWSRSGAPFVSIEAWTGHGDPDGFDGDITEKPSMLMLGAGTRANHSLEIGFTDGSR